MNKSLKSRYCFSWYPFAKLKVNGAILDYNPDREVRKAINEKSPESIIYKTFKAFNFCEAYGGSYQWTMWYYTLLVLFITIVLVRVSCHGR